MGLHGGLLSIGVISRLGLGCAVDCAGLREQVHFQSSPFFSSILEICPHILLVRICILHLS
jgi:hypothetical protein